MVALVAVGEGAVVAGGLARLLGIRRTAEVRAGLGIEVAELERLAGDRRLRARVARESAQDARATLGGLVEQDHVAPGVGGQCL